MNLLEIIAKTFSNDGFTAAVFSTVSIILLGLYLRKTGVFSNQIGKILSKVVLNVALPALAFTAFMQDIDNEKLNQGMNVLIWGIAVYIILIFISKAFYLKYQADRETTLRVLTIFGSTTFFGLPIVSALYGQLGALYGSVFNIGYRIFLYSYGYIKMSGLKLQKENIKEMFLNPIVIATFLGLFVWVFQDFLPQINTKNGDFAFLRIDKTFPPLFSAMRYLSSLASPLAWLAIGATLGDVSVKEAIADKTSWYYSGIKIWIVPAINVVALIILNAMGIKFDIVALTAIVIMMATPPATVAVAYAISFERDALLASTASLIATIVAVVSIPFWILLIQIIGNSFFQ